MTTQALWQSTVTNAPLNQCPYCGCWPHQYVSQCPAVERIEYYEDGSIKAVQKRQWPLQ